MNYQRNAIFAIALLGLLVLSACATTDENAAGDARFSKRLQATVAVNGDILTLKVGETGYTPTAQCVGASHELRALVVTDTEAKASVDGELTNSLKLGESQTLINGQQVTLLFLQNAGAKFSVDGHMSPFLTAGTTYPWFETAACEITLVNIG